MKKALFLTGILSVLASLAAEPVKLVEAGVPRAEIVVSASDLKTPCVAVAADELQLWIREITGATLQIVPAATGKTPVSVVLALTQNAPAEFAEDIAALKGTDGFAVRTRNNTVTLLADRPRGLNNAVHRTLFRNTDIIWARPNATFGTVFTKSHDLVLKDNDFRDIPVFFKRGWQTEPGSKSNPDYVANENWLMRNCSNWSTATLADRKKYDYILEWGGGHNVIGIYIRPEKYWKTHPEFFSQINGKLTDPRTCMYGKTQICFTNKELLEVFKQELASHVRANMDADTFRIFIEDNYQVCDCPECQKDITLPDGRVVKSVPSAKSAEQRSKNAAWKYHRSVQYFIWMNEIARFLKTNFPGKRIFTDGYFFAEPAPLIPLEDNIIVAFAPIYKDDRGAIDSPLNQDTNDNLNNWLKCTRNITWRHYYGLYPPYPRPIDEVAFLDHRLLQKKDIRYTYSEIVSDLDGKSAEKGYSWDFNAPYFWNLTNAIWNPQQDFRELRRVFYNRCFGAAAKDVEEFYAFTEAFWAKRQKKSMYCDSVGPLWNGLLNEGDLSKNLLAKLDAALSKVDKPHGKIMLQRIKKYFDTCLFVSLPFTLKAAYTPTAPAFDPTLSTGAWAKAEAITNFVDAPYKTVAKFLHDDKYLYVAMYGESKGIGKKFDPSIRYAQEQGLNFFFNVNNHLTKKKDYAMIIVDPIGHLHFAYSDDHGAPCALKHQQVLHDDDWTVMITLPLSAFSQPMSGAIFRRYSKGGMKWPNHVYGMPGPRFHAMYTFPKIELLK